MSPVEVARASLERVAAVDPHVNAFVWVDDEDALAQAAASEARWRAGEALGPIDGVPTTVKDLLPWRGRPTRKGSRQTSSEPATEEAPAVRPPPRVGRRRHRRDDDARVRLEGRRRLAAHRDHAQPVGPLPYDGRLLGRRGRRCRHRHGRPARRHRRRWIRADAVGLLRARRPQAHPHARADPPGRRVGHAEPRRPAGPVGARRRTPHVGRRAARPPRRLPVAARRPPLARRPRGRRGRAADRVRLPTGSRAPTSTRGSRPRSRRAVGVLAALGAEVEVADHRARTCATRSSPCGTPRSGAPCAGCPRSGSR